jgi:hypothetical protein
VAREALNRRADKKVKYQLSACLKKRFGTHVLCERLKKTRAQLPTSSINLQAKPA